MRNRLKEQLKRRDFVVGTWLTTNSLDVAELLATSGFDFLVFDMEHAPLTYESVQTLMQATNGSTVTPIVRVAWNDPVLIKLALDIGSYGLLIPSVNGKEEAEMAVRAGKYPPRGIRGVGPRRASDYYRSFKEYTSSADEEVLTIVQIEHVDAVKKIEEIASVPGVDALFIGPADLTASMNLPGEYSHPKVVEAVNLVMDASRKYDLPIGIHTGSADEANRRIQQGFRMIVVGTDVGFLAQGSSETLKQIEKGKISE